MTTLYRSAAHLLEFHARATRAARAIAGSYEIVLVNDGSPDESLDVARGLTEEDPRVRVLDLSRNFGHHKAIMTGLAHARGDLVFLIDCDLEEEPELLGRFVAEMERTGADVVYGVQEARKGRWFERVSGEAFYTVFNWISSVQVPRNVTTARLMTRRYVDSLVEHRDREIFLLGLWVITGFQQVPVTVRKLHKDYTTYSLRRRVSVFVNSVTSFSVQPLLFIFYLGCFILVLSTVAAGYLIIRRLFFGTMFPGWASLIVSVWLLGGLILFSLGIIGIYLAKVFSETKDRPYTILRERYGQERSEEMVPQDRDAPGGEQPTSTAALRS